ncbi:MAG: glycosyltransferase [Armatimonadia bacterium]|nr:glycosyltransferase [Armatimonadia bacterium]
MRLAVISHACVVDVNQRLFKQLCAAHPDIELLMIAPRRWRASTGSIVDYSEVESAGFTSRPLPVIGSGQISLHVYRGLSDTLHEFDPEIVYLDEEPYSLPAWQTLRICRRAGYALCFMTAQNQVKRFPWPFSQVERDVLGYADLAVPPAPDIVDVLRTKGFEGEIAVIPHFVDTDLFQPLDRSDLKRELGLQGTVIGYLGRLTPEKGLDDLREAADILWADGADISVLLVGGGAMSDDLREWSREHPPGRVVLTGPVPHSAARDYVNVFDILAVPSRTMPNWEEQFGRVLVEAPASEVPVVGSNSGNIPNLVEELQSGRIFAERDPQALADAITELLADPARTAEIAREARRRVRERYGLEAVAEKLYDALSAMPR